jgi:tyrosinase
MKSFFLQFLTALSLLGSAHAVLSSSPSSRSCGAPNVDDSYFSVVGVQGTGVHPRQDLRELEKDTETWNMFIQALARFQAMNQNDKLSYYKIAGMVVF